MRGLLTTRILFLFSLAVLTTGTLYATTVIPISDRDLHERADVVVHGVVVSSRVVEDRPAGRRRSA